MSCHSTSWLGRKPVSTGPLPQRRGGLLSCTSGELGPAGSLPRDCPWECSERGPAL